MEKNRTNTTSCTANILQGILEQGSYQGRVLTNQQKNNLMNYIEQINKFLVPVAQGI